jgi:hypothetical protein
MREPPVIFRPLVEAPPRSNLAPLEGMIEVSGPKTVLDCLRKKPHADVSIKSACRAPYFPKRWRRFIVTGAKSKNQPETPVTRDTV